MTISVKIKINMPTTSWISDSEFKIHEPISGKFILDNGDEIKFKIPKGFISDGASFPTFSYSIIGSPTAPDVLVAAIIHDWLYRMNTYDAMYSLGRVLTRYECDMIFYYLLRLFGCGFFKSNSIYYSVRLFGSYFYKMLDK